MASEFGCSLLSIPLCICIAVREQPLLKALRACWPALHNHWGKSSGLNKVVLNSMDTLAPSPDGTSISFSTRPSLYLRANSRGICPSRSSLHIHKELASEVTFSLFLEAALLSHNPIMTSGTQSRLSSHMTCHMSGFPLGLFVSPY